MYEMRGWRIVVGDYPVGRLSPWLGGFTIPRRRTCESESTVLVDVSPALFHFGNYPPVCLCLWCCCLVLGRAVLLFPVSGVHEGQLPFCRSKLIQNVND